MYGEIKPLTGCTLDDKALVKAVQAGRTPAFDELVLRYQDKIFNLCYRFLGDHQEANDLAQTTFLKAFRAINKFRFQSTFSTWLYRIAVNACKNRLKSLDYRFKKRMRRLDKHDDISENLALKASNEVETPFAALEKKQTSLLVQQAIDKLPATKKEVLVLRDIEDLSYEEIVRITGQNQGTVKSRLARARLDLKKKLRGVI